jgi:predicted DNA-binding protein
MKASAFKLPDEMRARLQELADKADRPVSEEVRQRLAASFERDDDAARAPKLAELQRRIAELADVVRSWGVGREWSADPYAFKVMRAGMLALLEATPPPPGEVVAPAGSVLTPNDDPETLGRTLTHFVLERAKALALGQAIEFDFRTK